MSNQITRKDAEDFLAQYHAQVWAAAESEEGKFAYDEAGRKLAKDFLARFDEAVPPAGDVKVLGYKLHANHWIETDPIVTHNKNLGVHYIEVCDRAHVTRLQAENFHLSETRSNLISSLLQSNRQRDALQSELTKALYWLSHAKPLLHSGGFNLAADDIGNFLAHQPAPAAKGESDE